MKQKKAGAFFDRGGTINTEIDFLRKPEELEPISKSSDTIREANESCLKVTIISNRSGIAEGFLTQGDLAAIYNRISESLTKHHAHVDAICDYPRHPDCRRSPYTIACDCRKHDIGMLKKAEAEFNLELKESFVDGDRRVDVHARKKSRMHPVSRPDCNRDNRPRRRYFKSAYDARQ